MLCWVRDDCLVSHSDIATYQVGPLPIGPDSEYVEQYLDGHIPWVKRPTNDLGDAGALVCHHYYLNMCHAYQTCHHVQSV